MAGQNIQDLAKIDPEYEAVRDLMVAGPNDLLMRNTVPENSPCRASPSRRHTNPPKDIRRGEATYD